MYSNPSDEYNKHEYVHLLDSTYFVDSLFLSLTSISQIFIPSVVKKVKWLSAKLSFETVMINGALPEETRNLNGILLMAVLGFSFTDCGIH
jgi:hypothetical protein